MTKWIEKSERIYVKERVVHMREVIMTMSDQVPVQAYIQQPVGEPVGHIHILHGMAEHMGRYDSTVEYFVEKGYVVSGHDHRGHGKTAQINGLKGHFADVNGFNRVVEDVYEVITAFKENEKPLELILFGHSMGSFIARRFVQLHGELVDLLVLSGTGDDQGIARYGGLAVAHLFGKKEGFNQPNEQLNTLVFGNFNRGISNPKTKFDWLSKNESLVSSYLKDEDCGFTPTTQFFIDLFEGLGMIHQKEEIARIPRDLPILLFAGTEDPVGRNGQSLWKVANQYHKAGIEDVTVHLFEGGRHELISDSTRKEVIHAVFQWVQKR